MIGKLRAFAEQIKTQSHWNMDPLPDDLKNDPVAIEAINNLSGIGGGLGFKKVFMGNLSHATPFFLLQL